MREMSTSTDISVKKIDEHGTWKHIPLAVGPSVPYYNDLIEFEELDSYGVVSVSAIDEPPDDFTSNLTPSLLKKQKRRRERQKVLKERWKLRKALLTAKETCDEEECATTTSSDKEEGATTTNNDGVVSGEEEVNFTKKTNKRHSKQLTGKLKKQKINKSWDKDDQDCSDLDTDYVPTTDMSEWDNLFVPNSVLMALSELDFSKPMEIQREVLPVAIRDKRDILGAAETGSGKTLAFGIPLIHHILLDKERNDCLDTVAAPVNPSDLEEVTSDYDEEDILTSNESNLQSVAKKSLPGLILTPTRELAMQVTKHLKKAAKYTKLLIATVVGGMASQKQVRLLNKQPDIVIATPGRLWELIENGHPYLESLHKLGYLVIDEADRMLERGHFEDLSKLLGTINVKEANKKRQSYVFSATLTTVHLAPARTQLKGNNQPLTKKGKLDKLMKKIGMRNKPHVVDLTTKKVTAENLSEAKIICDTTEKDYYLYYFLKSHPGRTLVFTNSIDCIFHLSGVLTALNCNPLHIHAKMQQRQRLKHLERFQENPEAVLIASDVAARGLDIPDVKHVIHYQAPRTMETYIHRSGRSARSGKDGLSVMFVSPGEMQFYKRICHSLKKDDGLPLFLINDSYMSAIRKRVNIAREIDQLTHQQKKVRLHNDWFSKTAEAMDMQLDEDIIIKTPGAREDAAKIQSKKQQMTALLKKPIFPKGISGKFITQRGELFTPDFENKSIQHDKVKLKKSAR